MAPGDDGSSACSGGTFSKMGVPIAATPPASSNVAAAGAGGVPSLSDKLWLEQQEKQRQNQNQNQQQQQQVASVISSGSISKKKKLFIPAAPSSSGSTGSMMGRQQQQLNSNTNAVPTSQQSNNGNLGPGLLGASIRMNTTGSTTSSVTFGQQVKRASPFKHSKRTMAMVYHAFGNCTKTKGGEEEDDDTFDRSNSAMETGNYENDNDFERNSLLYSTKSHGNYSFRMQQQQQQQLNKRRRISRMIFGGVLLSFGLLYMRVFRPRLNRRRHNSSPFGTSSSPDDDPSSATAGFLSSLRHSSILSSSLSGTENNDSTQQSQSTSKLSKNVNVLKQGAIIPFPLQLSSLSNLTTTYNPTREIPYFWDVHFSGESIAEAIFGHCHGLVQACEFGLRQPDYDEDVSSSFAFYVLFFVMYCDGRYEYFCHHVAIYFL